MKKLKALLINGSPRAKGCTYTALTELKNTLEQEGMEVELIHVGHKDDVSFMINDDSTRLSLSM